MQRPQNVQTNVGGHRRLLVGFIAAVALIATACPSGESEGGSAEGREPVSGGILRFGVDAEVDGLNPTSSAFAATGTLIGRAVFDTLIAIDENDDWVPKLAKSIEPNDDFTKWTLSLREGVTFHDGTPLDGEAVAFNFNQQRSDPLVGNALAPYYVEEEPITVVDDLTVTYNLVGASSEWPMALTTQLGMMGSPDWLRAAAEDANLSQQPVGAGPFKFDSRQADSLTRVVRNDDYFNGPAYLDAIEFYPTTDETQLLDQILGDALDGLMTTSTSVIESVLQEEEDSGALKNVVDDTNEEAFLMINSAAAPFDDIRVRQALTYSTPREAYLERISEGVGVPANQMFTPEQPYFNPDIVQITDDPDRAAPLVEEYCAEFGDNCTDGRINMEYQHTGPSPGQTRIADLVSEGWSEHFNVTINEVPQDDLVQNVALGLYQTSVFRQFGAVDPYFDRVWIGCETIGAISLNWPRYCDDERDALLQEGLASTDEAVKIENMQKISESMNEAFTYIFIDHQRWTTSFVEEVGGFCDNETAEGVKLRCSTGSRHFFEQLWIAE